MQYQYPKVTDTQQVFRGLKSDSLLLLSAEAQGKLLEIIRRMEMQDIQADHGRFGRRAYQEELSPI